MPIDALRDAGQIERWHREKGMLAFSLRELRAGGAVVDVIVRPEVSFDRLMANAVAGDLFGRHVPIASIDDLLVMKRAANRPKDRLDIIAPCWFVPPRPEAASQGGYTAPKLDCPPPR